MIYKFTDIENDVHVTLDIEKISNEEISIKYKEIHIPNKLRGLYKYPIINGKLAWQNDSVVISSDTYPAIYIWSNPNYITFCISGTDIYCVTEQDLNSTKIKVDIAYLKAIRSVFKPINTYATLELL